MGRRWEDLTPAEQDEEWKRWQERDTFADRLSGAIDDAWKPVDNFLDPFHSEPREREGEDYSDYRWGDGSVSEDTGCSWIGWLVLLAIFTFPFSLYFIVGLCAVVSYGLGVGIEILSDFVDQLFTLFSGL